MKLKFKFSVSDLDPENLLRSSNEFVFFRKGEFRSNQVSITLK